MEKVIWVTTTYDRAEPLERLRASIEEQRGENDEWLIVDDGTPPKQMANYREFPEWVKVHRFAVNGGRRQYWSRVDWILSYLKSKEFDAVVFVPDDAVVVSRENILDDLGNRNILSLHNDQPTRLRKNNWDRVPVEKRKFWHDGFIDMMFVARREWFEAMDFHVKRERRAWDVQPNLGSGVGAQLTRRTRERGIEIFIGKKEYLKRDFDLPSKMNGNKK